MDRPYHSVSVLNSKRLPVRRRRQWSGRGQVLAAPADTEVRSSCDTRAIWLWAPAAEGIRAMPPVAAVLAPSQRRPVLVRDMLALGGSGPSGRSSSCRTCPTSGPACRSPGPRGQSDRRTCCGRTCRRRSVCRCPSGRERRSATCARRGHRRASRLKVPCRRPDNDHVTFGTYRRNALIMVYNCIQIGLIIGNLLSNKTNSLLHRPNSLSPRINSYSHRTNSLLHRPNSLTPRINSHSHRTNSLSHRIYTLLHRINLLSHRPNSVSNRNPLLFAMCQK